MTSTTSAIQSCRSDKRLNARITIADSAMVVVLWLSVFWDFRYYPGHGDGFKPFELLALATAFAVLVTNFRKFSSEAKRLLPQSLCILLLLTYLFVAGTIGVFENVSNISTTAGMVIYACIGFGFRLYRLDDRLVLQTTRYTLLVCSGAIILQYVFNLLTQDQINFQAWIGGVPRNIAGSTYRPSGLFLEPAHHCIVTFMLLTVYILYGKRRIDIWVLLGALGMLLSTSLWGLGSLLFLILIFGVPNKPILTILAMCAAAFALLSNMEIDALSQLLYVQRFNSGFEGDPSFTTRTGGLTDMWHDLTGGNYFAWFGSGLQGTESYVHYGASSFGFLMFSFGVIGCILFFLLLLYSLGDPRSMAGVVVILFSLTATVMWVQMFWWLWIVLVLRRIPPNPG